MWDILEVTHEGTIDVKGARKHALIEEYEMFRMLKGETIADVQKRFTHIDVASVYCSHPVTQVPRRSPWAIT